VNLAPIALFAYNRPEHLKKVAAALARNPEAADSRLLVFSDAPKDAAAEEPVAQVREAARGMRGFASVEVIARSVNQGVARSIIEGVSDLTARFGCVIVLEDDLLPSAHFLGYMNNALERYAQDSRVISVHAYSYPVAQALPDTFFLRGADCWGWATWKRGWDLFEPDGEKLLAALESQGVTREFDYGGAYPYTQMLRDCIAGRNDSWAIRWYASAFLANKLTLYPGSSQVQNIGADGTGLHVGVTRRFEHSEWGRRLSLAPVPVLESKEAREAFAVFLGSLQTSLADRLLGRFKTLASLRSR